MILIPSGLELREKPDMKQEITTAAEK